MFHCFPNVIETSKKRQKISLNSGDNRGGGVGVMEPESSSWAGSALSGDKVKIPGWLGSGSNKF